MAADGAKSLEPAKHDRYEFVRVRQTRHLGKEEIQPTGIHCNREDGGGALLTEATEIANAL